MQILLHYDKVMLEKASKVSLDEVKLDLRTNYAQKPIVVAAVNKVDDIYSRSEEFFKKTHERFEEMNKAINLEIYSAVKKGIKEMTKLITKAAEDSENKTKGLTLELQKLIHSKASK